MRPSVENQTLTGVWKRLQGKYDRPFTNWYLRFLSVVLFYGATVHISNMAGWSGEPWLETPLLWRMMDVTLLGFNIIVGIALWHKRTWGVVAFLLGLIFLQFFPYTLLRPQFIRSAADADLLNQLLGSELILWVCLLLCLLWPLKAKDDPDTNPGRLS